jgi:polynucleotide 5'-kinase involved in rRNA processing
LHTYHKLVTTGKMDENFEGMTADRCRPTARTVVSLPLNAPIDYTPYSELEFDQSVRDYCRNISNHSQPKQEQLKSQICTNNKFKHANYAANTPLNKIVRSCKVVVSGDVAVGKTSLINRFGNGVYSSTHRSTIGVDFDLQRFNILGQPYVLQVSISAGLE